MLHALIHRKLDPLRPDAHRLEDVLTSCVFTTLLHAGAGVELCQWLASAEVIRGGDEQPDRSIDGLWFWPRLAHAEPDVVIRLGSTLLVIEAKLRSGRHDRAADPGNTDGALESDQLRRQWQSLADPHSTRLPALQRAIAECHPLLAYIVDAGRVGRARRELAESVWTLPINVPVRLLTWQQLYCLLARAVARPAWSQDLIAALELFGVGGFVGIANLNVSSDELERVRSTTLAKPSPARWATSNLDPVTAHLVQRWVWKGGAPQTWQWNVPALADARNGLAALAPFLIRWVSGSTSEQGVSS